MVYEHRHEAKSYTSDIENEMYAFFPRTFCLTRAANDNTSLEAMAHPRNVGWGETGLDYHYDNSPRDIQREVFSRQLRHAVRLGKPITVHTREADEDTECILKAEVPKDHKVQFYISAIVFPVPCGPRPISYMLCSLVDLPIGDTPTDTRSLFHRLSRFRTALIGSFPQPLHWYHWHVFFSFSSSM
jgi:Tat protein secretion system quality control protein TatD with DNase activity